MNETKYVWLVNHNHHIVAPTIEAAAAAFRASGATTFMIYEIKYLGEVEASV